ncbi:hypothetical protein ACKUB1_04925 [Methanospirillum stamsii]|uniref:Uncharacterized protein n=1 Tax=Methanospirillum stamsii TaxID=1277351 RepID=A0A2V2N4H9_9EURY|nr:hypothetical protein [Methanospirillum stamsii]PWR73500.1 hypothetical protein DLD82_09645 [Methanospirillum stamsii]
MNPPGIETLGYQSRNPATYPDFRTGTRVKTDEALETKQNTANTFFFITQDIPEKNGRNSGIFIQKENLPLKAKNRHYIPFSGHSHRSPEREDLLLTHSIYTPGYQVRYRQSRVSVSSSGWGNQGQFEEIITGFECWIGKREN